MDEPVIHSESWTGPPEGPKPDWYWRLFPRAMTKEEVRAARADARNLTRPLALGILASGAWMTGGVILMKTAEILYQVMPAIPIDVPPIWAFGYASIPGFLVLMWAARHELPPFALRVSCILGILLYALALSLPPLTLYSYLHAEVGPRHRMQLVRQNDGVDGAVFALDDGSLVEAPFYWRSHRHITRNGECFSVRRLAGPFGFSWMKVLETTPRPQNSELWWTITRDDCFSNKPLSTLGH
jgi:hypothetical protein